MSDLSNLRRLRERSFVAVSHYTPYCETHQAMFSILSSCYPSPGWIAPYGTGAPRVFNA
jgi:hypothetical protein